MAGQGVDEVAAELYSVPPARFVTARDDAVRQAREAGDRDLAGRIGRLRKPTMPAWAVNLLARSAASRIDELVSLGERLRSAQQALQGDQLRALNQQRRELVGSLSREAARLAADAGYPLSGAALVEVEQTLVAALAEQDAALAVRQGRLTRPLQHVGMGAEPLLPPELAVAAPPAAERSDAGEPDAGEPAGEGVAGERPAGERSGTTGEDELTRRRRRREQRREQELRRATTELGQAESRLDRAEQDARRAEERAARAERKLAELQREHADAVRERDEARRRARSAVRVRDDARRRVQRLTEEQEAH